MSEIDVRYQQWIDSLLSSGEEIHGMCSTICERMNKAFPELILHGGFVRTPLGTDVHYWLVSPDGDIIDPTEAQFGELSRDDYYDSGLTSVLEILYWYLHLSEENVRERMASQQTV